MNNDTCSDEPLCKNSFFYEGKKGISCPLMGDKKGILPFQNKKEKKIKTSLIGHCVANRMRGEDIPLSLSSFSPERTFLSIETGKTPAGAPARCPPQSSASPRPLFLVLCLSPAFPYLYLSKTALSLSLSPLKDNPQPTTNADKGSSFCCTRRRERARGCRNEGG